MKKIEQLKADVELIKKADERIKKERKLLYQTVVEVSKRHGISFGDFNHTLPDTMLPILHRKLGEELSK